MAGTSTRTTVEPFGVEPDKLPELSEEAKDDLQKRMAALDALLASEKKAKYKIELFFGSARSTHQPTPGALSFWESGTKLHGGGDTKLYICPGKTLGRSECESFIPDTATGFGHLVCPSCGTVWKGEEVHGELLARLTMQGWAGLVHRYFTRLEHNADVYVKHPKEDLRAAALEEQERQYKGEKLFKSRSKRVTYIYPLKNIITDTAAGADLLRRFYSLLTA